ncbi:hypothetical protein E8D73_10920 [Escherichia coli]|nr:hypothetical protein [Escherichia coli]MDJ1275037.1 hypothetical protein [Escherichia coli]
MRIPTTPQRSLDNSSMIENRYQKRQKFPVSHLSQFVIMDESFLELSSNGITFVGSKLGSEYNKKTKKIHKPLFLFG